MKYIRVWRKPIHRPLNDCVLLSRADKWLYKEIHFRKPNTRVQQTISHHIFHMSNLADQLRTITAVHKPITYDFICTNRNGLYTLQVLYMKCVSAWKIKIYIETLFVYMFLLLHTFSAGWPALQIEDFET